MWAVSSYINLIVQEGKSYGDDQSAGMANIEEEAAAFERALRVARFVRSLLWSIEVGHDSRYQPCEPRFAHRILDDFRVHHYIPNSSLTGSAKTLQLAQT